MTSATNERRNKRLTDQARRDEVTNEIVINTLMSTRDGRRWVWLRLASAQVFVEDESLDPAHMAYRKGIRNEGLRLLADVTRIAPSEYITMTSENTSLQLKDESDDRSDD